jgi:hypothetical protein
MNKKNFFTITFSNHNMNDNNKVTPRRKRSTAIKSPHPSEAELVIQEWQRQKKAGESKYVIFNRMVIQDDNMKIII